MKKLLLILLLSGTLAVQGAEKKDPKMDAFITGLMGRMTLEEKLGQLNLASSGVPGVVGTAVGVDEAIRKGYISASGGLDPEANLSAQKIAVEESRLGIPMLFGLDVIHGYKTIFPIPLASSCSWNPELIERSARIAAEEASSYGINWVYSPMVDIARDPRWGRIAEGAGEDPWWGSQVARAMVRGYQGDDLSKENTVMACVKHFALYGASEAGRDYNTVDMSRSRMYNEYLPPYRAAFDEGAGSAMSSFNTIDGIPATGNRWLLTDLLRGQWGFDGFVVSDAGSIGEMTAHGMGDMQQVAALALRAGLDMDMGSSSFVWTLKKSLDEGKVSMQQIDQACRRILEAKYKLGLFEHPYQYVDTVRQKEALGPEFLQTARELAGESIVLLKNDRGILPLKKSGKIAVVGPLADSRRELFGTWTMIQEEAPVRSVLEAMKEAAPDARIVYAQGANLTEEPMLAAHSPAVETPTGTLIREALQTASDADVIVAVVGEPGNWSGEARCRADISLPESQRQLLWALKETGKPVVVAVLSGRPLTLTQEDAAFDAILEAWHGGTMGGYALSDVLFGDRNPSGRLTATFPRSVGQIPVYYSEKNTGRPYRDDFWAVTKYLDMPNDPLYPFGYGLSYTTFEYGDVTLDRDHVAGNGPLNASVRVTNTGTREGQEVVQLYIGDPVASISRPVRELRNFRKITLKPGESRTVAFCVTPDDLKFYNEDLNYVWEPGEFRILIGPNSRDLKEARVNWTK